MIQSWLWGIGAVVAHLYGIQKVAGSNPAFSTVMCPSGQGAVCKIVDIGSNPIITSKSGDLIFFMKSPDLLLLKENRMKKILVPTVAALVIPFALTGCWGSPAPGAAPGPTPIASSTREVVSKSVSYSSLSPAQKEALTVLVEYKKDSEKKDMDALSKFNNVHPNYTLSYTSTGSSASEVVEVSKNNVTALYRDKTYNILKEVTPSDDVKKFSESFEKNFTAATNMNNGGTIDISVQDRRITFSNPKDMKKFGTMSIPNGIAVTAPTSSSVVNNVTSFSGLIVDTTVVWMNQYGGLSYGTYIRVPDVPQK